MLKLSESALVNYRRDRTPRSEELLNIAKYFGVSMEWLLTGEDDGQQPKTEDGWKQRALSAEQKIQTMKAGVIEFVKNF
jgi:transcriptional regulator with XRE-family HTH domain